jgi:putative transposase
VVESSSGTLQLECIWQTRFDTYEQAKAAIAAWVKRYNESRPHSRLGYLSPVEWRRRQGEISA